MTRWSWILLSAVLSLAAACGSDDGDHGLAQSPPEGSPPPGGAPPDGGAPPVVEAPPVEEAPPLAAPSATIVSYGFVAPLTVHLDGTFSSCPGWCERITWDFGDGSAEVEGWLVQHAFPGAGTYTVTMKVTDGESGLCSTATHVVALEPPYARIVFYGFSAPFTAHLDATFSSCASGWCKPPTWDFGDGSCEVDGWWLHHEFPGPGTYTVTMRIEDGETGVASYATETIEICAPY